MTSLLFQSASNATRLRAALRQVAARVEAEPNVPVNVLAPSLEAGRAFLRELLRESGRRAALRWRARTLRGWAYELALPGWAEEGLAPIASTARHALLVGLLAEQLQDDPRALGRYREVAERPGFAEELAALFAELGTEDDGASRLAALDPALGVLHARFRDALAARRLVDASGAYLRAAARLRAVEGGKGSSDDRDGAFGPSAGGESRLGPTGVLVALDLELTWAPERALLAALAEHATLVSTRPLADGVDAGDPQRELLSEPIVDGLSALRGRLFREELSAREGVETNESESIRSVASEEDEGVEFFSAADESRESMEIVRRCLALAERGVAFDRMTVVTLRPDRYRGALLEAFARAEVPVHLAPAVRRPDPAGRAFLALLHCADERLSAARFAEYLSLAVVPIPDDVGAPPAADPEAWVASDDALLDREVLGPDDEEDEVDGSERAIAGQLRVPRAWERLLVEAAVIGRRDRWERRLVGYAAGLESRAAELRREDPEHPRLVTIERERRELETLRDFALPLLDELVALPERASWGEWVTRLAAVATRALREPARVLQVLGELAPMGAAGPVRLREVRLALGPRLTEVPEPTGTRPAGAVRVASAMEVRGASASHVFIPGLSGDLFPTRARAHPFLSEPARRELGLRTRAEEVQAMRADFLVAIGAAEAQVVLSWARSEPAQGRVRVPSFYVLDAVGATRGALPSSADLRAEALAAAAADQRWPAPRRAEDAVDVVEFDLAMLREAELAPERAAVAGSLRYAVRDDGPLRRSTVRRWRREVSASFGEQDGLVSSRPMIRRALADQRPAARPYSASALQKLAGCPYAFFLHTIARLHPAETPVPIEALDPLQRGSLIHEVIFEASLALRDAGLFGRDEPQARLAALRIFDEALARVAARYAEELAPAFEGIWEKELDAIRVDLHRLWDQLAASDWVPERFELAFGMPARDEAGRDPLSVAEPVRLEEGLTLRGAIDVVERKPGRGGQPDTLRVSDYKTGKYPGGLAGRTRVGRGKILQPALYALALERLVATGVLAGTVEGGRLYYASSRGGFRELSVSLDPAVREAIRGLAETVDRVVQDACLPAHPRDAGECTYCDYRDLCGPGEHARTQRKRLPQVLAGLVTLRGRA